MSMPTPRACALCLLLLTPVIAAGQSSTVDPADLEVDSLRFFAHSLETAPAVGQRQYGERFEKSSLGQVAWQLDLEHPAFSRDLPLSIRSLWYRSDRRIVAGRIVARRALASSLDAGSRRSSHMQGWDHGGTWPVGVYTVELYVRATKVATGSFEIVESTGDRRDPMTRGFEYLSEGNADGAIAAFTEVLASNVRDAGAYNARGAAHLFKKEHDRAIADFSRAIAIDRKLGIAYRNRGEAYEAKGQDQRAIADYTSAVRVDPRDAKAYGARGELYRRAAQYELALADLGRAIELDETNAEAYTRRGLIHAIHSRHDEAIDDFTRALRIDDGDASIYNNRGAVHYQKQQYDLAIADFERALEIDPTFEAARAHLERSHIERIANPQEITHLLDRLYPTQLEAWQTSWDEFAKEIQQLHSRGAGQDEFIARFNGKQVHWEGKVIDVQPGTPPRVTLQMRAHTITLSDGRAAILDTVVLPVNGGFSVASDKTNRFHASLGKGDVLIPAAVSFWQIEDAEPGKPQARVMVSLDDGRIE